MVEINDLKIGMKVCITQHAWQTKTIGKIGEIVQIDKGDDTVKIKFPSLDSDWWYFDLNEFELVTEIPTLKSLEEELELAETAVNDAKIMLREFKENNRVYSWNDLNHNAPTGVYQAQGVRNIDHAYRFYVNDKNEVLYVTCGHQGRNEIERANEACWHSDTFKKVDDELTVTLD